MIILFVMVSLNRSPPDVIIETLDLNSCTKLIIIFTPKHVLLKESFYFKLKIPKIPYKDDH